MTEFYYDLHPLTPHPHIPCHHPHMRRLTAILCLTPLAVLRGSAGMSESADYEKGLDAWEKKGYATALREWKPLAEQGDAAAQIQPRSNVSTKDKAFHKTIKTAVKWFRLAAEQG